MKLKEQLKNSKGNNIEAVLLETVQDTGEFSIVEEFGKVELKRPNGKEQTLRFKPNETQGTIIVIAVGYIKKGTEKLITYSLLEPYWTIVINHIPVVHITNEVVEQVYKLSTK
jgi:hypothetical protein